jgi:hypothetical protein
VTIRDQILHRIIDVVSFVRVPSGHYYFLPSIQALRYLAAS